MRAEIEETGAHLGRHTAQAAIFAALLLLSVFPLLAFLVIGLGKLLNNQYWLSSLIIGVLCAGIGGVFGYRAYTKIRELDLTLPHTRDSIEHERTVVGRHLEDIRHTTKRRAA
jgi:hypothetical protein